MPSASPSNSTSTTPFITFIPAGVAPICYPPNALGPDRDATHERTSLDPNYPAFQDAMTVREEVFVKEQGVPLENELDEDDHRSFHWVVYASVASSCTPPHRQHHHHHPGSGGGGSSTTRIPVGTIRLVPPPAAPHMQIPHHQPHQQHHPDSPPPADILDASSSSPSSAGAAGGACGEKNYIKLGRLATIPAFRGLGIGKLLVETALTWAAEHPEEIMGDIKSNKRLSVGNLSIMEQMKKTSATATSVSIAASSGINRGSPSAGLSGNGGGVEKRDRDLSAVIAGAARGGDLRAPAAGLLLLQAGKGWEGKVLVHAQKDVKKMWEKFGFVYDPGMGEWVEEGIVHVGLWKQLQLKKPS